MSQFIKHDGEWREPTAIYVKNNGNWDLVSSVYVKKDGEWVLAYDSLKPGPPKFVTTGKIEGDPVIGQTITYSEIAEATGIPEPTVTWGWYVGGEKVENDELTYTLQPADIGKEVFVRATATNDLGEANIDSNRLRVRPAPTPVTFTVELWGGDGATEVFDPNHVAKGGIGAYMKCSITANGDKLFKVSAVLPEEGSLNNGGYASVFEIEGQWIVVAGGGGGYSFYRRWIPTTNTYLSWQTGEGKNATGGFNSTSNVTPGGAGSDQKNDQGGIIEEFAYGAGGSGCAGGTTSTSFSVGGNSGKSNIRVYADSGRTSGPAPAVNPVCSMTYITGSTATGTGPYLRITNSEGRSRDYTPDMGDFFIASVDNF